MKTVLCHGCFDVIHAGHLAHLHAAKQLGDRLIVSVTTDRFVNKGPGRPHFPHAVRAEMLRALRIVDEVVLSDNATAIEVIQALRPDVYVKGSDYANGEHDIAAERAAVEAYGGRIAFTDELTDSSSRIINNCFGKWSAAQQVIIEDVRSIGGMDAIKAALLKCAELSVIVAGECIADEYIFVEPQGISSKSPSLSVRQVGREVSAGGSSAIAAHLRNFCIVKHWQSGVVHKKTRFIAGAQRLFEVCEHPAEQPLAEPPLCDALICADFGHGFFEHFNAPTGQWTALNVQTNSSNFGFNRITRWSDFNYLVCDNRELLLDYGKRDLEPFNIALTLHERLGVPLSWTRGPDGAVLFTASQIDECPAFASSVVDATGAGDAYFALTSLLMRIEASPLLVVFLGNVFAGLKTRIQGNSAAVSKLALLRACEAILK